MWGRAFAGTAFITVAGNAVILLFLYFDISPESLNFFVAFAVGGMLGDVFLHLLPHAQGSAHDHGHDHGHGHEHGHDHEHGNEHGNEHHQPHAHTLADLTLGLSILSGLVTFFLVEKYLRFYTSRSGHGHSHHHSHNHEQVTSHDDSNNSVSSSQPRRRRSSSKSRTKKKKGVQQSSTSSSAANTAVDVPATAGKASLKLKPAALLNLCADTLHNFTDGLAIAVACQASTTLAISTILAVAVHELPHEIGDFAVLVQHGGFTKWGAFMAQWVSALGAFLGCFVGLQYGAEAPTFVIGFTAGGFIYISCVNIMPDMLNSGSSMKETLLQVVMMGLGVAMMVYVALYCE